MISLKNPENLIKTHLTWFRRYGCLNYDISKYGHMNKNAFIFIYKSEVANVMTYYSGTCLPNFIDFGLKMGVLCMNLYINSVG